MGRVYKDLNKLYKEDEFVFLTNSLGEETGHREIPTAIFEWYNTLYIRSPILLYLSKWQENFGVMGIYEFDECFRNDVKLSKKQYWKAIRKKADTLAAAKELKQSALFLGDFSGFGGCHEIALWFPYPISKNKVQDIVAYCDEIVYEINEQ